LEKIGEGGMGQVWLAEQAAPLRRKVALKLIRAGMYDEFLLQRFQAERQSLALMDHPAIAKVFDAGASSDGQPYFVMEYVEGEPITKYCDRKKLKIRERLELFVKVCEGVQHAHQKAIIHRDLKPANIFVGDLDGKPTPRIIDFGLAKPAAHVAGETLVTRTGGILGTPGYISPEQADPNCQDIDTRTDVYSLGVILYELLTGLLPFDAKDWKRQPLDQVLRQLREQDAPRPSTKVQIEKESSTAAAEMRGTEPKQLASLLQGDLDWITLKAIEKDRTRRYGTPSDLAADIGRYLKHEPVYARPASAGYRLRKYVRRHGVAVSVGAGLIILVAGFTGVQAVQLRRIAAERDRAARITNFMTGMFKISDPSEARGNSVTAREILDKASSDIDAGLSKDPELQSQLMYAMGKVYENLGLYPKAQSIFGKAIEVQIRTIGQNDPQTLQAMNELAIVLFDEGRYSEAEKQYHVVYDILLRTRGPAHTNTAKVRGNLGTLMIREGHYVDAEKLLQESLTIERKALGTDNPDVLIIELNLFSLQIHEGHYAEAERMGRETLETHRRVLGADHFETLKTMNNLAVVLRGEGKLVEAENLDRETLHSRRRVLGPEHPDTLLSMRNLADVIQEEGRIAEADESHRETLRLRNHTFGAENLQTLQSVRDVSTVLYDEGRYSEAEKMAREALDAQRRILGPQNPEAIESELDLVAISEKEGRCSESEKMGLDVLDAVQTISKSPSPLVAAAMNNLSLAMACNEHFDEATRYAQEAFDMERGFPWTESSKDITSKYYLASIAAMRGQRDEAISLLQESFAGNLAPRLSLTMAKDPNLKALWGDPRFDALVTNARDRIATEKHD
jgi:eukaryotic-like serine/threonine-protein kinase